MASLMDRVSNFFSGNDADTGEGLKSLFITELKDIYYAEGQAIDALAEQADAATTDEVRNAFLQHQEESRNQRTRLERVFDSLGVSATEGTCDAIDGLADDGRRVVSNTESGSLTRDAGLIMAAQKVEHHEIASYGSAVTLAKVLGYHEAAQLLQQTLDEEKNTDKKLTQLAESFINQRAAGEGDDMDNDNYDRYRDRDSVTNEATMGAGMSSSGTMGYGYTGSSSGMTSGSGMSSDSDHRSGSTGSGMSSGSQYGSGSGMGSGSSSTGGYSSGSSMDDDDSSTPRYNPNRDATLGGTSGV
ncbi:ferritin-like domain-containing protein [Rudanella lutea]|uniref:YciE/YciF ferroxidase family protein n=1 Tax=Rudanella lutea TaxID=451374 RepID=UPI000370E823|nr:ferritin-like domain-containing protein [Rudanella lutea]